jgi:hypothetical protein
MNEEQVERKRRPFSAEEGGGWKRGAGIIYDIIVPPPHFPSHHPSSQPPATVPLLGDSGLLCLGWEGITGWRLFHLDSSSPIQEQALHCPESHPPLFPGPDRHQCLLLFP